MKRRSALRSLALVLGGTVVLPAWATSWNAESIGELQAGLASADQTALLAEIVETIIPTTDSPGAKALGVHLFILKMLADCYEKPEQTRFLNGLTQLEEMVRSAYGKSFVACSQAQRLEILQGREAALKSQPAEKDPFFPFLKNMTIQGYLNSEYVMREVYKYELVPGRYHGCVPVKLSAKK
jgi:Gluconate 2-dehydrogenase subunit 3